MDYKQTLIMLHGLWINMCHVLDVEHRFRCLYKWWGDISLKYIGIDVCVGQRATIRHSDANIPGKSAGRNLLSHVFYPLLLAAANPVTLPPYLQITLNQWKCSVEALKLKTESTVLHSQSAPECCAVTATLEDHLGQCQTHRALLQKEGVGRDILASPVKGRPIIQYQIKAQSLRLPR